MTIDEIIGHLTTLDGVLTLRPSPGDGSPEIAWGDSFFYYAPDGEVPARTQPFATIVTKNYPGDDRSQLDRPGSFRLNISVGPEVFREWTGRNPRDAKSVEDDPSARDTVIAHPVYDTVGWLAVVDPGTRTTPTIRDLLRIAYDRARSRTEKRR
ncbi:hypothetical protein HGA13_07190 [Nocardia speluncae]|uniref:DUF6194 domain-containing protein n=1 Tax=Nocardia speluncae TaxID=419477 RepID=A0A846XCI9_9NOCA|nr:DUF6194 family protein [Nocardia speluncae]NKY32859.1 hypothetical protein [Nocardia speluncae]